MEEAGDRKGLAGEPSDRLYCWAFTVGGGEEVIYGAGRENPRFTEVQWNLDYDCKGSIFSVYCKIL